MGVFTLECLSCDASDQGKYQCIAENALGSDETECRITVNCKGVLDGFGRFSGVLGGFGGFGGLGGYGGWVWWLDMVGGYGGWVWWVGMVGGYGGWV